MPFLTTLLFAGAVLLSSGASLHCGVCRSAMEDLPPRTIETSLAASAAEPPAAAPVEPMAAALVEPMPTAPVEPMPTAPVEPMASAHVELPATAHVEPLAPAHVEPPAATAVVAVANCAVPSCTGYSTDLIAPKMAPPPLQSLSTSVRESAASSAPASELLASAAIYYPPVGCANAQAARGEDAPLRESKFVVGPRSDGPAKIIQYRCRLFILAHHRKVMAKRLPLRCLSTPGPLRRARCMSPWWRRARAAMLLWLQPRQPLHRGVV